MLISDTTHHDEQVLELQSGSKYFVARLKLDPRKRIKLSPGCQLQLTEVYASADENPPVQTLPRLNYC